MAVNPAQIPVTPGSGLLLDATQVTVAAASVDREVIVLGDPSTGAAYAAVGNADPGSSDFGLTVRDVRGNASLPVRTDPTGTTTQPVSAVSLPLPTGAATAAKQPALGTAGTPSADVISVQGVSGMTPVKTDGSGVTQPVSIAASVPVTGTFFQTTQPVSIATAPPLVASAAIIGKVGIDQTTPGTTNKVSIGTDGTVAIGAGSAVIGHVIADSGSTTAVTALPATPAGTNLIGKVGIDQTTPGTTNAVAATLNAETTKVIGTVNLSAAQTLANVTTVGTITNTVPVKQIPQTSGGLGLPFSASVTTKVQVKGSAGQVYGWQILNNTAAIAYIQVFNALAASVTLGSTTPDYVLPLPPSSGATLALDLGIAHGTGITVAATTTRGGSTTAACDVVMWFA